MGNRNNNTYNNGNYKPKSGCKIVEPYKKGEGVFIVGFKLFDGVMRNVKIFQTKNDRKNYQGKTVKAQISSDIVKSGSGKKWVQVTMTMEAPFKETLFANGLMDLSNHKVYFKDLNWIVNPKASNGGYIGKHISKNYN
ncbi:hypothetical protein C7447_102250 [Tenacibaculum adriaticum]|uniref:Uncharacterized protein n=1 Tax=Tenacibaculum adriaticum TaxID=413713 RepID=A0A5S5DVX4_9FLAO|nr:hypothetical protein [Tenacibaculum adriaticum]TYP98932.1 hypothetical protein C7447_102250 [Tenacibaculum adriaticum]